VGVRTRRKAESQKKTLIASEQERPDVARRRAQWIKHQHRIDPCRLVFIDETWTKTNMAALRGGTVRNSVREAMMMERRESSHGYRERTPGSAACWPRSE
jgi:hypothetical protein